MIKSIIKKVGFSNFLSIISLFISLTCLAIVARISKDYSIAYLEGLEPENVPATSQPLKVSVEQNNTDNSHELYDNVLHDIDKLIEKGGNNIIANPKEASKEKEEEKGERIKPERQYRSQSYQADDTNSELEDIIENSTQIEEIKKAPTAAKIPAVPKKEVVNNNYYKVLLGSFASHAEASKYWFTLRQKQTSLPLSYIVDKSSKNGSAQYLLKILAKDNAEAKAICQKLKSTGVICSLTS